MHKSCEKAYSSFIKKKNREKSRNTWALLEQMAICEWSKIIFQLKGQATRSGFGVDAFGRTSLPNKQWHHQTCAPVSAHMEARGGGVCWRRIVWPHPKCFGTSIILECVTSVKIILRHPSIQARPPKFFTPSSMQIFPNMAAFVRDKSKKEQQELYTQT